MEKDKEEEEKKTTNKQINVSRACSFYMCLTFIEKDLAARYRTLLTAQPYQN